MSIQSILEHVVNARNWYVYEIRNAQKEEIEFETCQNFDALGDWRNALLDMFANTVQLFEDYPDLPLETYDTTDKILTRWGQTYDVEQLMEHAIVHILRHRRQIKRFLLKPNISL